MRKISNQHEKTGSKGDTIRITRGKTTSFSLAVLTANVKLMVGDIHSLKSQT